MDLRAQKTPKQDVEDDRPIKPGSEQGGRLSKPIADTRCGTDNESDEEGNDASDGGCDGESADDNPQHDHSQFQVPSRLNDRMRNTKFCRYCQNFIDSLLKLLSGYGPDDRDHSEYPHHGSLSSLRASSQDGCSVCWLLNQYMVEYNYPWIKNSFENSGEHRGFLRLFHNGFWLGDSHTERTRRSHLFSTDWSQLMVEIRGPIDIPGPKSYSGLPIMLCIFNSTITLESDETCPNSRSPASHLPLDYTSSLCLAKKWLEKCRTCHHDCKPSGIHIQPSRLLRIEASARHLSLQDSFPGKVSYATLSHCWGSLEILKLTKDTLTNFRQAIPFDRLCRTFQDAIFVSRHLGFEYLWIDSLCIIQDDEEDWIKESALMSDVYGGTGLNIAAASAVDGNGGLFLERVPINFRKDKTYMILDIKSQEKAFRCTGSGIFQRCVQSQPLAKRAWALQERVLPIRTIHFSSTELLWECRTQCACELFPDKLPEQFRGRHGFIYRDLFLKGSPPTWQTIVGSYTGTNLTFSRDKLVAISGIAQNIHRSTKDQYFAGLWRRDMEQGLCWGVNQPCAKLTDYRAPTWSWASVDGNTFFPFTSISNCDVKHQYIEVIDVQVTTAVDNQFGEVSAGVLTLACECLVTARKVGRGFEVSTGVLKCRYLKDFSLPETTGLYCLLFVLRRPSASRDSLDSIEGLVLQPTQDEQGQYQRVGYFSTRGLFYVDVGDALQIFDQLISTNSSRGLDESNYREIITDDKGKKRYVITII